MCQRVCDPKKDPTCSATSTTINRAEVQHLSYRSSCAIPKCDPKKDPTCPATSTTINTTAEYNTSATESTVAVNVTEECASQERPTCPAASTTINYHSRVQHLSYRIHKYNTSATESSSANTTEGVCDPKKDPTCPATSTVNTTAEYNTSATESTIHVSMPQRELKKDPTCPATSTINTTAEYNTRSATESTVTANTTEGVCDTKKKDPTCSACYINYYQCTTAEYKPQLQNHRKCQVPQNV
ncbi:integumentary mucin A.1-like [Macrobrachium rosenbergii]|uniref:integumentary mucin A.1-like n=1 Tax=Macrobrachium rosenbergii TaxID=79674 RepID=UPI0034D733C7